MSERQNTVGHTRTEATEIEENTQITVKDTGWSEEEKERMIAYGYDSLDLVRAWYS